MSKLRNIYLYLVCFVTLMMILFGVIFTVQSVTDLIFPEEYYSYPMPPKDGEWTEEDKKQQEEMKEQEKQNARNRDKKGVAKSVAVVFVALPTFVYHWRKIEKEKKNGV